MPKKSVIKKSALAPTVLIAGGAGFIGSHLAETLLLKDAKVVVMDNFKTGKSSYVNHLIDNPKFALFDADISQGIPEEIESVDYIFHLAGLEEYLYSKEQVNLDSLLTNALGTKNLLDLANRSAAKFLLASSIDVYQGMISQVDLKDYFGDTPKEERQYSQTEAKRFAEALVWEYYKKNDTNVRIVRLPEVFGPRMDLDSSGELGRLVRELMENKDLTVYGEGVEKQYYLYVTSAVTGLIKALFNQDTEAKIYPLVDKETYSQLEIVYLLKSLANREVQIQFKPRMEEVTPEIKIPDTSNLKDLGWESKIVFREGVIKTLKALNYEVNENAFKPAKLIQDKVKLKENVDSVSSLVDMPEQPSETVVPVLPISVKPVSAPMSFTPKTPALSMADISAGPKPTPQSFKVTSSLPLVTAKPNFKLGVPRFNINLPKTKLNLPNFPQMPVLNQRTQLGVNIAASLVFSSLLVFVVLPLSLVYFNTRSAINEIKKIPVLLTQFNSNSSKESSYQAFQDFNNAQISLQKVDWLFAIAGQKPMFDSINGLFGSLTYFSKSAYNFSKATIPVGSVWEVLKPTTDKTLTEEDFAQSKIELTNARTNLQLAQAALKTLDIPSLPAPMRDNAKTYSDSIGSISTMLDDVLAVYTDVPDLIGVKTPKKYLVLFQNSNELRPTGGFIGSYATLEFSKGKLKNLTIDDIYNPDGQIDVRNIKVAPPAKLAEFLKEDRSYIRNANWNPDFPTSAKDITDLFFSVTGEKYDGVIALDLHFAEQLLRVTGPVFLTAYNEEINADNMYERAQFHSEFNYKEGSDQKRSFLTVLGAKLLERIFSMSSDKTGDLISSLGDAFTQRHLMVYVFNSPISTMLTKYNWDGSVKKVAGDYLQVVNANVGGTKANYYVKNAMKYEVLSMTRDGTLRSELNLSYDHTGKDMAWPSGPYKDYVRVVVPNGAKLTGAYYILNEALAEDVTKNIEVGELGLYSYFGYSFTLNPQEKGRLFIKYDLPKEVSISNDAKTYSLYWQKESGTQGDTIEFKFNPPFGMNSVIVSPDLQLNNSTVGYTGDINTDKQFSIELR